MGEPVVHDGPIILADPDPGWPGRFEDEAARVRAALGDAARRIEHVGSTSVPGLAAKPVIDVVLAVDDSADEASYVPALQRAGYELRIREPDWHEHRLLRPADGRITEPANVHVFSVGDPEIDRMLAFRDLLRRDPAARARYEATKRELAARHWRYVQHYADAKSDVIDELLGELSRADRRDGDRPAG